MTGDLDRYGFRLMPVSIDVEGNLTELKDQQSAVFIAENPQIVGVDVEYPNSKKYIVQLQSNENDYAS